MGKYLKTFDKNVADICHESNYYLISISFSFIFSSQLYLCLVFVCIVYQLFDECIYVYYPRMT